MPRQLLSHVIDNDISKEPNICYEGTENTARTVSACICTVTQIQISFVVVIIKAGPLPVSHTLAGSVELILNG